MLNSDTLLAQGENKAAKEKFDADIAAVKLDAALDAAINGIVKNSAKINHYLYRM